MELVYLSKELKLNDDNYKYNYLKETNLTKKTLRDLLLFFNITKEDLPKVLMFIGALKEQKKFIQKTSDKFQSLTNKEKEILKLVVEGYTSKQISTKLFVQSCTVFTHRKNIKRKLETHSLLEWKNYYDAYINTY